MSCPNCNCKDCWPQYHDPVREFWPWKCDHCNRPILINSRREAKSPHKTYAGEDCPCPVAVLNA